MRGSRSNHPKLSSLCSRVDFPIPPCPVIHATISSDSWTSDAFSLLLLARTFAVPGASGKSCAVWLLRLSAILFSPDLGFQVSAVGMLTLPGSAQEKG